MGIPLWDPPGDPPGDPPADIPGAPGGGDPPAGGGAPDIEDGGGNEEGGDADGDAQRKKREQPDAPQRRKGEIAFGGGMIKYYAGKGKPYFEALCPEKDFHKNCTKKGAAYASPLKGRPAQGRPLGMLAAWILDAHNHLGPPDHPRFRPTLEERKKGRAELMKVPGILEFLAEAPERPKRDGEEDEPEECP